MNSRIFIKNGYYCKINRDMGESYESYLSRGNFIISQKPKTKEELNKLIVASRIWLNMNKYNSKYSDEIKKYINDLEKKL